MEDLIKALTILLKYGNPTIQLIVNTIYCMCISIPPRLVKKISVNLMYLVSFPLLTEKDSLHIDLAVVDWVQINMGNRFYE